MKKIITIMVAISFISLLASAQWIDIGTTLTTSDEVNIGGNGQGILHTRHVNGKAHNSSEPDHLYLNWDNEKYVIIGNPDAKSNLYTYGQIVSRNADGFRINHNDIGVFHRNDGDNYFILLTHYNNPGGDANALRPFVINNSTGTVSLGNYNLEVLGGGGVKIAENPNDHELRVCGTVIAKEVIVEESWCDYVFEPEYCLTTLEEEAEFIKLYGHLSNFESAKAMDGMINVNDIFKRQQVQIEENVLHLIELNDENEALKTQVNTLEERLAALEAKLK